jgi:hypothetical protein
MDRGIHSNNERDGNFEELQVKLNRSCQGHSSPHRLTVMHRLASRHSALRSPSSSVELVTLPTTFLEARRKKKRTWVASKIRRNTARIQRLGTTARKQFWRIKYKFISETNEIIF